MILNNAKNLLLGATQIDKVYAGDFLVWTKTRIGELTDVPPLEFVSEGSNLLDWHITGAAGGVGNAGTNKLKQREYTNADNLSNMSTDPSKLENIIIRFYSGEAIPPGSTDTSSYQQWYIAETAYIGNDRTDYTADDRPCEYQYCQLFSNLKAGSYKLICEYYHNEQYPWLLRTHDNENPYIALIDENDNILIKKSMNQAYAPVVQDPLFDGYDSSNRVDFYHDEYSFTLSADTAVGFISKIYPQYANNVFLRFQIVSADVIAESFYIDEDVNGVTCWEPYSITIPVTVTNGEESQTVSIPVPAALGAGETISFADTNINIPTYNGNNIITVDTETTPSEMYIKYYY